MEHLKAGSRNAIPKDSSTVLTKMSHSILPRVRSIIEWLSKLFTSHLGVDCYPLSNKYTVAPKIDVIQPKRGPHGYYKFQNGLLNVTPISSEEEDLWAIWDKGRKWCLLTIVQCKTKHEQLAASPTSHRRSVTWSGSTHSGSSPILPCSDLFTPWPHPSPTDKFPILHVCRQIYLRNSRTPIHVQHRFLCRTRWSRHRAQKPRLGD